MNNFIVQQNTFLGWLEKMPTLWSLWTNDNEAYNILDQHFQ
jgi:hypothetical protein